MKINRNPENKKSAYLYHITSTPSLLSIINSGEFQGRNTFKLSLGGNEIRPLSLTTDKSLKYANQYFKNLDVLVQFKKEVRQQYNCIDIDYNMENLMKTSEGQAIFKYIVGENEGNSYLSNIALSIQKGNSTSSEILRQAQECLSQYSFEKEVVAVEPIRLVDVNIIQFYLKRAYSYSDLLNGNSFYTNIVQIIKQLPYIKCSVVDINDNVVYTSKNGWVR